MREDRGRGYMQSFSWRFAMAIPGHDGRGGTRQAVLLRGCYRDINLTVFPQTEGRFFELYLEFEQQNILISNSSNLILKTQ